MRIIVTGATSFIGVHLVEKLLEDGHDVVAVVRPASRNLSRLTKHEHLEILELDISELAQLAQRAGSADAFYHLAWEGVRGAARDNECLQRQNCMYAVQAMEAALDLGCSFFVGAGSQAEYGMTKGPVDETHACNPVTAYGKAKWEACQRLGQLAEQNRIGFAWVRIFSVYGRYDYSGTMIMSSIEKMKQDQMIGMTACTQKWDYLYIADAAQALSLFCRMNWENGIYHLASGESRPLRSFVEEMKAALQSRSEIVYGALPYGAQGPVSLEPVVKKIQDALKWKAQTPFSQGIRQLANAEENE